MVPAELTPITGRVVNHAKLLAGVCVRPMPAAPVQCAP